MNCNSQAKVRLWNAELASKIKTCEMAVLILGTQILEYKRFFRVGLLDLPTDVELMAS
uniref:Uncharacterized protein n=1 Tax=Romanomermis culicivorax TaxID=13658 RepID=A0A915KYA0_ROMCU